ncbi:galactose oxidase [Mycena albidolilacea]|uniref:Galactose oxidase n=1 Tax=Mycena albidolilacea TaxID=1033008 RepID=A0AAD6ZXJ5_9AGAR|nr:galactose oxidase [Mycena albidolilacea]
MAKKKPGNSAAAKAAKKVKAAQKVERTTKKKVGKQKKAEDEDSDDDLEGILEKLRVEWEEAHKVTEELADGPPSRRANATLTACPTGNNLWCIGGEFFSEDGKAYFYSDVYRYSPEKDEWRRFVSPTCPGPRSAHAVAASPAGGGKLFLFGGEFSSLHQNSFHHYRDFWAFDIQSHTWDRIDTKIRPSARSGHRMAIWKHYIVLFGGFYDPGITTRYLNDLWLFDLQEYKWRQIEFRETELRPSPRSGFSFLPTPEGIVLHGGYCKEYTKGKRPVGVMLEDTWFLKLTLNTTDSVNTKSSSDPLVVKWERRKRPSTAYAPALRSGCTMTLWAAKNTGILFGGVTDEDTGEETLESVFWNDLNGYQIAGKGKWVSMTLKRPKNKGKSGGKKKNQVPVYKPEDHGSDDDEDMENTTTQQPPVVEVDPDDPQLTTPLPRYNAMLAVLRNTLYIYGGIFEKGKKEYTLDDFYSIQLDKLERYTCLKESGIVIADDDDESSEDDEEEDEDEDDTDEEEDEGNQDHMEQEEQENPPVLADEAELEQGDPELELTVDEQADLRLKATAFMGVSKERSPEELLSTPLPGETLAMFYARSRAFWAQKAHASTENQGKQLRRDGFTLAEDTYKTYKPILKEVEKILAEAGLDEEEMRQRAAGGGVRAEQSRNRR